MNSNKKIYHVFRADVHFMTVSMIEDIILTSKLGHFFIIVGIDDENSGYFLNLFAKYNYAEFSFIQKNSNNFKTKLKSDFYKKFFHA